MYLGKGERCSRSDTCVISTADGNEVTGIEAERVYSVREEEDQESMTIPEIKTEPRVQMESTSSSCEKRKNTSSGASVIGSEPRSLNDIPYEMLLEILSNFELEDLCLIIAKVCEKWKILAKDVIIRKNFHSAVIIQLI
jgi:hypothetical protein